MMENIENLMNFLKESEKQDEEKQKEERKKKKAKKESVLTIAAVPIQCTKEYFKKKFLP